MIEGQGTIRLSALVQSGLHEGIKRIAARYHANVLLSGTGPYHCVVEIAADQADAFREEVAASACGCIEWHSSAETNHQ